MDESQSLYLFLSKGSIELSRQYRGRWTSWELGPEDRTWNLLRTLGQIRNPYYVPATAALKSCRYFIPLSVITVLNTPRKKSPSVAGWPVYSRA